jgi:hypothetical protein
MAEISPSSSSQSQDDTDASGSRSNSCELSSSYSTTQQTKSTGKETKRRNALRRWHKRATMEELFENDAYYREHPDERRMNVGFAPMLPEYWFEKPPNREFKDAPEDPFAQSPRRYDDEWIQGSHRRQRTRLRYHEAEVCYPPLMLGDHSSLTQSRYWRMQKLGNRAMNGVL